MALSASCGNDKSALRKHALSIRLELPIQEISLAICQNLQSWALFHNARQVLFYYPFRGEVDLLSLTSQYPEKKWYLPKVSHENQDMGFFEYRPTQALTSGKYGVLEPSAASVSFNAAPQAEQPPIFLIPGLLFDRQGYRLGYGKGYFDRFLARQHPAVFQDRRVGVVPASLCIDSLPQDPWDVPMDFVMTEQGLLSPGSDNPHPGCAE